MFVYVGVYDSKADAEADYDLLKELHRVIVGEDKLDEAIARELRRARKTVERQIETDAKAFDKELEKTAKEAALD